MHEQAQTELAQKRTTHENLLSEMTGELELEKKKRQRAEAALVKLVSPFSFLFSLLPPSND